MGSDEYVLAVFTGGTISVSPSRDDYHPSLGANELLAVIGRQGTIPVKVVDLYRMMSESLTWEHLAKLVTRLRAAMQDPEVRGVVVSHGTDSLEEVGYLVDLLGPWSKPVVFTGAMRHSESLSADGPANLFDAVAVAHAPDSINRGVLVVMNQEIHAARYVVKEHATNLATFVSPGFGPLGSVVEAHVCYYWAVQPYEKFYAIPSTANWPCVETIRVHLAASSLFLKACLTAQVDGVVVEGFGSGHIPEYLMPDVNRLIEAGIRVWVVPRTARGQPLLSTYNTPGSEVCLQKIGVKMSEGPGYKARLRMTLEIAQDRLESPH